MKRVLSRNRSILLFLATLIACASRVADAEAAPAKASQPNIVFILSDDQGYEDCGFMGGKEIPTPALDSIAKSGAILKAHYVQLVCSPTRAALMTGRYATHTGMFDIVMPGAPWGLPLEERTLALALREAGYETAICGKWHLGEFEPAYRPTQRGFDHQYGLWYGAIDYNSHKRDKVVDWHRDDKPCDDQGYSTHLITKEAVQRIQSKADDKPLFLYMPFNAVHAPYMVPKKYLEPFGALKGDRRIYAGMVAAMDEAIGQVVDALKKKGIYDNTIIVFSSDNGGPAPGAITSNGPFRAGKGTLFEGGVRSCACVAWPGHIPSGQLIEEPMHIIDWYPTLVRLAGGSLEQKRSIDGVDVWPMLVDKAKSPHDAILHCGRTPQFNAIRIGDWKLVHSKDKDLLFNLVDDIGEKKDLAQEKPDKAKELRARLDRMMAGAETASNKISKGTSPDSKGTEN